MQESSGEKFLKENNLIHRSTPQRQQLLGCLGCRWNVTRESSESPTAYGYQIMVCTGLKSGVVYPLLSSLEDAGVTASRVEDNSRNDLGRPPRRFIEPSDTELGYDFANSLTIPENCSFADSAEAGL